ncbi:MULTISPECIES: tRNA (adenosine(37)-N6)-threonylcarbamoyltransferase complex ATPase subunit type 1 TsaE [unclassified Corynebacterium]|uniref:tRNA (adenosine(37)-N6)-threonylcarbamoyltransferase complex ATPase subunit type 1 TsaE n=1 Tax=unclassified Corynebacterium TaxID=2624378 RepID=UPI0029CA536A|nr:MULTISPECIES: tRNA (adenosine(37)-N6)-threonylcarbamoyltransferase complex ATPase subunit type 1 TsaE [unclassified Corynebacterium]WPF66532.1 tRNA (adenosine(37)-N6)-threonylcarbamoyltransferase complex ATPase subunit type 1 TsaE [Corynebacterium sp. 22KM0430]WPF69021.1 tRNA (adenosine(37)-N6)-threonylcarbamoyltransferase complex ATPase subunit type 1 TsaE [Corynebacterium sp. 21KM1197]
MRESFPQQGSRRCEFLEDTQGLGAELGAALEAGDVVLLDGPLGAGKTALTQGIARGMGVRGRVTSPTFIIAREHRHPEGGPTLIHVDAYRLLGEGGENAADPVGALDSLDLDSALAEAVVVAEWGGGLVEQIAGEYLFVHVDRTTAVAEDPDSEARIISWQLRAGA